MKKMSRKELKKNLVIAILIAIVGIIIMHFSNVMVSYRMFEGYSGPTNGFLMGLQFFGIMILEWGSAILGVSILVIGLKIICYNIGKLMR